MWSRCYVRISARVAQSSLCGDKDRPLPLPVIFAGRVLMASSCCSTPVQTYSLGVIKARQPNRGDAAAQLSCSGSAGSYGVLGLGSSLLTLSRTLKARNGRPPLKLAGKNGVVALFQGRKPKKVVRETVIPDADYRIPFILLGAAGASVYADNLVAAVPLGLLGLLLLVQAGRVRFVFDDEALDVRIGKELEESGENAFVGGRNRWMYSSFVNWEFWWPSFPVLVYFKETQTKPEGQIHFFPIIFNGKQLYEVMVERAGPSKTSGPK